ncbi:hypothetical protein [Mycoplasmopsis fermentans]|nr:hypothetical protein [Mycoplasmopsis fermentans]
MKKLKNFLLGISSTIPASGVFLISSTNSKNEDSFNNWNESIKDKCPIKNANWEEIFDILKSKLPYKKDIELVSYSGMKDNLNSKLKLNKFSDKKTPKEELLQYWKNLDINLALNNYLKNKSINKNEFFKFDFEIVENQYLNIYLINENVSLNKTSRYLLIKNQKINWKLSSDISQLNWKERLIINYGYNYKINNDGTIQIKESKSKNITSNEIICEYPPTEIYFVSPQNLQEKFEIRIESENGEKIVSINNNEIFYSVIDIRKIVKNKLNFSNKLFLIHEDSNGIKEKIQIKFEKSDISNTIDLKYPNWNPDLLEYKQFISKNELNKDGNEIKDANGNPVPSKKYDPGIDPKTGLKSEIVWLNFNELNWNPKLKLDNDLFYANDFYIDWKNIINLEKWVSYYLKLHNIAFDNFDYISSDLLGYKILAPETIKKLLNLKIDELNNFLLNNLEKYCYAILTEKESKFLWEFVNDKEFGWNLFLSWYEGLKHEYDKWHTWDESVFGPYPYDGYYFGKNVPDEEIEKNIEILYGLIDLYDKINKIDFLQDESVNKDSYSNLKQLRKYKNHFDSNFASNPFGSFYLKYKNNNSSVLAEAIKTQYLTINANSNILIREIKQNSIGKWEFVNDSENMEISNSAPGKEIKLTKNGFYLIYDISLDKTNINKFKIVWIDNNSTTYTKPSYLTEEANSPSFIKKFWRNKNLKVSNDFEKYLAKKKIIDLNITKKDLDKLKYDDIFNEYNNFLIEKSFEENFEIKPEININKLRQDFKTNEQFLNYINQKDNEAKFIENYVISKNKEFLTIKNCYFDSKSKLIKVVIDLKENASLNSFFIRRKSFNINLELKPIFIKFNSINIEEHIPFNVFVNELTNNNLNNLIKSAKDINNKDIDLNIIELKLLKDSDENQIIVKSISKDKNYYIANNDTYTYNVSLLKSDYSYLLNFNPGTLNVFGLKDKEEIKKYIKELLKNYLIKYNEKIDQSLYKKITIDDINISFNDEELNKIINPKDDDIYWNKDENIAKFAINFNNNFKTYHPCTLHVINNAPDDDFNWPEAGLTVKVNVDMENKKDPVKMAQIKNEAIRQVREKIIEEFKKRAPKLEIDKLYTIDFTDSFFNNLDLSIGTTLTLKGKHFMLKNPYTVNVINTHSSANKKLNLKDLNFEVITLSEKNLNDFKKALNEKIIDILKKENYPAKEIIKLIEFKLLENQKWDSFFSKVGNNELKMMIQLKEESNLISGDKEFKLINIFTEEMLKEALEIKSKNKKKLLSWLIPVIILSVAGIIATVIAIWYRKKKKHL